MSLAQQAGAVALLDPDAAPVVQEGPATSDIAVVRDIGGIKVGFLGFGQSARRPAGGTPDVEATIRQGVAEAKKRGANVLVALVADGRGEAKRIADALPELTAVVVGSARSTGDGNTTAPQGEQVGNVVIAQAGNHLQSVAVLDLFVRDPVVPGSLLRFADATGLELAMKRADVASRIDELHTRIAAWERDARVPVADIDARKRDLARLEEERRALDHKAPPARGSFFRYSIEEIRSSLGTDPGVDADMASYYKAVDEHNRVAFADRVPIKPQALNRLRMSGSWSLFELPSGGPRGLGTRRVTRTRTPHSRSNSKSSTSTASASAVTGYDKPGGSTVTHVDKLQDVGCEVCHGPGSRHVLNPLDKSTIVGHPDPARCVDCHKPPHVEGFDPSAKLADILGPGHGMAAK